MKKITAFIGSMIGHEPSMFTLPEGIKITMNANNGTIKMLTPAVK